MIFSHVPWKYVFPPVVDFFFNYWFVSAHNRIPRIQDQPTPPVIRNLLEFSTRSVARTRNPLADPLIYLSGSQNLLSMLNYAMNKIYSLNSMSYCFLV